MRDGQMTIGELPAPTAASREFIRVTIDRIFSLL